MTGVIKLLLTDDEPGSGVQLTRADGTPLPGPASYAAVVGKCINDVAKSGPSNIVNDGGRSDKRCDLTGGATLKIKLDLDTFPNASFALPGARVPVPGAFCVRDSKKEKCNPSYATAALGRDDATLIVTLQNLKSARPGQINPKIYSVNFAASDVTGRPTVVSLDPKMINRPRDDVEFLSFTAMVVVGAVLLAAVFLIGRSIGRRAVLNRRG